jgi:hypothetical protein
MCNDLKGRRGENSVPGAQKLNKSSPKIMAIKCCFILSWCIIMATASQDCNKETSATNSSEQNVGTISTLKSGVTDSSETSIGLLICRITVHHSQ